MKSFRKSIRRSVESGSIAVEAALVIPVLVIFLGIPSILLAFYCRQYMAAQKAVHDVALYLSTAPYAEITTTGPDGNFAAITVAKNLAARELAGVVPEGTTMGPEIYCKYKLLGVVQGRACTITLTKNASYTLHEFQVGMLIPYINPITGSDTGVLIAPYAETRYLGN